VQGQDGGDEGAPPGDGLGPKFHAPAARSGVVVRRRLVNQLLASNEPVISVVAPPGYGKTTVLS
jgi:ATP/maltotriose-dependent transcriptional regulator MalT